MLRDARFPWWAISSLSSTLPVLWTDRDCDTESIMAWLSVSDSQVPEVVHNLVSGSDFHDFPVFCIVPSTEQTQNLCVEQRNEWAQKQLLCPCCTGEVRPTHTHAVHTQVQCLQQGNSSNKMSKTNSHGTSHVGTNFPPEGILPPVSLIYSGHKGMKAGLWASIQSISRRPYLSLYSKRIPEPSVVRPATVHCFRFLTTSVRQFKTQQFKNNFEDKNLLA